VADGRGASASAENILLRLQTITAQIGPIRDFQQTLMDRHQESYLRLVGQTTDRAGPGPVSHEPRERSLPERSAAATVSTGASAGTLQEAYSESCQPKGALCIGPQL
jgi:hypothetical protein